MNNNNHQQNVDKKAENITRILEKVKQDVAQRSQVDVATPFRYLDTPKQKENPVLRKIDFYEAQEECETYESHGYKKRRLDKNQAIALNQLHESSCDGRHVMLVASVGAGKSTLVKRYCRMTIDGEVTLLNEIQCILLLEFKYIEPLEKITPESLLLNHLAFLEEHEKRELFLWMKDNPSKVLIAIDGLDQAQFSLEGERMVSVGYDSQTSPKNVILHLFSGRLFKESYLLTSSREYAAMRIPNEARPSSIITLQGLQSDAVERLVKAFAGKDGEHVWEVLSTITPSFLTMCEAPLFLILATASYKEKSENRPSTLPGLMMHVLLNFVHSSYSTEKPVYILKKLMKLSFIGIKRSLFTFSSHHFKSVDLGLGDVNDLIIEAPKETEKIVCQRLLEGDISRYFCHLSIQEALAALHIAYIDEVNFAKFAHRELYNPYWAVVRRMLCASMIDGHTYKAMKELLAGEEPTNWTKKKEILKDNIKNELESTLPSRLPILMILQECGDDVDDIRKLVNDIRISYKPLTKSDMHNITSVVQHRPVVNYVGMTSCNLTSANLCIFEKAMKENPTKIKRMEIPFNKELCEQSCRMLGKIVSHCNIEDFSMQNCKLTVNCLRGFKQSLLEMDGKLPVLDLRKNLFEHDHVSEIIALLPKISQELWIQQADLSEEDVALLKSSVSQIPELVLELH